MERRGKGEAVQGGKKERRANGRMDSTEPDEVSE